MRVQSSVMRTAPNPCDASNPRSVGNSVANPFPVPSASGARPVRTHSPRSDGGAAPSATTLGTAAPHENPSGNVMPASSQGGLAAKPAVGSGSIAVGRGRGAVEATPGTEEVAAYDHGEVWAVGDPP